jgi:hypothetical protein
MLTSDPSTFLDDQPFDWSYVVIFAIGLFCLVFTVWTWRGRTARARWWAASPFFGVLVALVAVPGIGGITLGAALFEWGVPMWLCSPLLLAGFVSTFWGFVIDVIALFWWPAQRLWGPGWYSRLTKKQVEEMHLGRRDILEIGANKPPAWAGKNLNFWHGKQIERVHSQALNQQGCLWISENGIYFDPYKDFPGEHRPARIKWEHIHQFQRRGTLLTITSDRKTSAAAPQSTTDRFRLSLLRARRAGRAITEENNRRIQEQKVDEAKNV